MDSLQNTYGLHKSDITQMKTVFQEYPEIEQVILFGSRSTGKYHNGSDIDLAIFGSDALKKNILIIADTLEEETLIPYCFDVLNGNTLSSLPLKKHIETFGKEIYTKSSS